MSRIRTALVLVALLATLAGCADEVGRDPFAGAQGRACQAVEYSVVEAALGVRFDSAASAQVEQTWSCVLTQGGRSFPEVTATMSVTPADALIYRATVWPSGATTIEGLGRIAYQLALPAGAASGQDGGPSGPGVQIGWLSAAPQMMTLRYLFATGASDADVAALTPALLNLAHGIEEALVAHPPLG